MIIPQTIEQIIGFQATHTDWYGKPLNPDGAIGQKTRWALDMLHLHPWRQQVVASGLYDHAKGVIEVPIGSNRSPEIDKYLRWCNLDPLKNQGQGFRWCASAASYFLSTGTGLVIKLASVNQLAKSLYSTIDPLPGDLAYIVRPDGTGHCGIVLGVTPIEVMILEGNFQNRLYVVRRLRIDLQFATAIQRASIPSVGRDILLIKKDTVSTTL